MNNAKVFCKSSLTCCVINFLLGLLGLHLKISKICVLPVVQLYVEMFELVNRLEVHSTLI